MHARLHGPNNLFILHQILNFLEPDFPCLADEIAKPRQDMNIKVAAFTVSEKSINMFVYFGSICVQRRVQPIEKFRKQFYFLFCSWNDSKTRMDIK